MSLPRLPAALAALVLMAAAALTQSVGPDVIVAELTGSGGPRLWFTGSQVSAFSVGTTSCNTGDQPLPWVQNTPQHPVIAQNLYRLQGGRFESIGISWVKHGFFALQQSLCGSCQPASGSALGPGCSDPYTSMLNGDQSRLGPRSEVNPTTGVFPFPFGSGMPPATTALHRRLQVRNADLDPALNPGARYFAEGHYIHPDDAAAGNDLNNASWREVGAPASGPPFPLGPWIGGTVREQPAVYAWQAADPGVRIQTVDVPGGGRFIVACRSTPLGGGMEHHEFAVHNLNSHRACGSVTVDLPCGAQITNPGFHDVPHHSGEPQDGTDWPAVVTGNTIRWATTQTFQQDPFANALRWGTLYNFRFDADGTPLSITLGLFRPGTPGSVQLQLSTPPTGSGAYQQNSTDAYLDINGLQSTGANPAVVVVPSGSINTVTFFSTHTGQLWDLAHGTAPLVPRSACAVTTPGGQVLNVDVTDPAYGTWFGGTLTSGPPFYNFSYNFSVGGPSELSLQMAIVAPNLLDGIALSQATHLTVQ